MPNKREIDKSQRFFREFTFKREAIDVENRTVPVSFSSETDTVLRWGEPEILDHTGANLTRLNNIGVVLFNHDPDQPIGSPVNARVENSRGLATLVFDDDEASDRIFQKVVKGTLRGISFAYTYDDYSWLGTNETSADGRFQGPCLLVKRWTALEISVVSVPADATVGVGRSDEDILEPLIEKIVERCLEKRSQQEPPPEDPPETGEKRDNREAYLRKLKMYEKAV